MDVPIPAEMRSFGEQHFCHCDLGDKRLTDRLVRSTNLMLAHPGGTLPDKLNRNADLIGFYRLANHPNVSHGKLIAAHRVRTLELIGRCVGPVLIFHDTTELDFSGLDSVEDIGPIGHGGCKGYLAHNSLAYDVVAGEVLGLTHQTIHKRRKAPRNESAKARRAHPERESRLWGKGWRASPPRPGILTVNIADRGADIFEFIEAVQQGADHYVIRSKTNRIIELTDGQGRSTTTHLHDFARGLGSLGQREVDVSTNHGHKSRVATVSVSAAAVSIKAPQFIRGDHSRENVSAWVVRVCEIEPPEGEKPLEWILLTNLSAANFQEACTQVDWYACRPIIEEFHKAAKTGCGIELPQFTTRGALEVVTAVLSVVATQLLRLRDLSRRADATTRAATEIVDAEYVATLSAYRHQEVRLDMNVHDFCQALAKLGGHLNRRHDGPPGWLVLWRGWTKLQLMVDGAQIARTTRCV
jgi:Transposase DNA-binding